MLDRFQEVDTVFVVFENNLLFIDAGGDVIDSVDILCVERTAMEGIW